MKPNTSNVGFLDLLKIQKGSRVACKLSLCDKFIRLKAKNKKLLYGIRTT